MKETKVKIHDFIKESIKTKISDYQSMLDSINESKNNETKSSAGDKFETGRAMMQAEQDKVSGQLDTASYQLSVLNKIELSNRPKIIGLGSLVICDSMRFYISISYGKVVMDGDTFYSISLDAPIGKLLLGRIKGEEVIFNGRTIKIQDVH